MNTTQSYSRRDPRAWIRLYLEGLEREERIVPGAAAAILPKLGYTDAYQQLRDGFHEGGAFARLLMPGAKAAEGHPIKTVANRLGLSEGSVKALFEANAVAWAGRDEVATLEKMAVALQTPEHEHRSPILPDPLSPRENRVAAILGRLKSVGQINDATPIERYARDWARELPPSDMPSLVHAVCARIQCRTQFWGTAEAPRLDHADIETLRLADRAESAESVAAMKQESRYAAF